MTQKLLDFVFLGLYMSISSDKMLYFYKFDISWPEIVQINEVYATTSISKRIIREITYYMVFKSILNK